MKDYEQLKEVKKGLYGGYVYILLFDNKHIKIGKTKTPYQRINSICKFIPSKLVDYYVSEYHKNYSKTEIKLHQLFKSYKVKGEWFKANFIDVINSLKTLNLEFITEKKKKI